MSTPSATTARPSPAFGRAEAALVLVTALWGATFLVVRHAMTLTGPLGFVALRFALAAAILALATGPRRLARLTRAELAGGAAIGAAIALGYGLQTAGLQDITASSSAFLTALYVPLVPLLQWLALRRPPGRASWAGIALASLGLLLMTAPAPGTLGLGRGEALTLLGALAIAAEVILISRAAGAADPARITFVQMAVGALLCLLAMPVAGEAWRPPSAEVLALALGLALASAAIQLTMNWAQRTVSPTRATLIYAGEPVWAGIFGRLAGERLGPAALAGAALILAGVLVSSLGRRGR